MPAPIPPIRPAGDGAARILLECSDLLVGEWGCGPGSPAFRETVAIGWGPQIVFPSFPVGIEHLGRTRGESVVGPTHAVFYDEGQELRRTRRSPRGDHCFFLVCRPALLHEARGTTAGAGAGDPDHFSFARTAGPVAAPAYLWVHRLGRHLSAGLPVDDLAVQETLYRLVALAVAGDERQPTSGSGRDEVEAVKALLAADPTATASLAGLAAAVGFSEFHLARRFRAHTGYSIHGYLEQLRLRLTLPDIGAGGRRLADIAVDAGFASHSHYTTRFTRAFGVPPSRSVA